MNETTSNKRPISEQVVVLFQGGGALGSYQVGLYSALHENNIEPDWIIGTSIGAINASIIAGNAPENRLEKLKLFWKTIEIDNPHFLSDVFTPIRRSIENSQVIMGGVNGFFKPKEIFLHLENIPYGLENAAHYDTSPLRKTLNNLIDFEYLNSKHVRLMLGAVNVNSGEMVYFDNHNITITVDHIMASGALPPAFPAVIIDGEPYWDGGLSSNSPGEAFVNTLPRLDSVVFVAHLWDKKNRRTNSLNDIKERIKDIQFGGKASNQIRTERQKHEMRQAINLLLSKLPKETLNDPAVKKISDLASDTQLHFISCVAPRLAYDDYTKDIDFSKRTLEARMKAGYEDASLAIKQRPWEEKMSKAEGFLIHNIKS